MYSGHTQIVQNIRAFPIILHLFFKFRLMTIQGYITKHLKNNRTSLYLPRACSTMCMWFEHGFRHQNIFQSQIVALDFDSHLNRNNFPMNPMAQINTEDIFNSIRRFMFGNLHNRIHYLSPTDRHVQKVKCPIRWKMPSTCMPQALWMPKRSK